MADALPSAARSPATGAAPVFAAFLLGAFALLQALATNNFPDLFIYRLGAVLAAEGKTPYDVPRVRERVAEQFPDGLFLAAVLYEAQARVAPELPAPEPKADNFLDNCGYFPPPLALVVYMPFAMVPWLWAKVLWAVATGLGAYAIARLPELFRAPGAPAAPRSLVGALVPFILVLNPVALATVVVGQTPLVLVGCVAAGQMAFARGRTWLGAALWAVPFVKPHLALPLIPLAWYLGGWKRAAALVAVVAALNLIGATMAGGSPLYLKDYFDYLPLAHKSVLYNRAELNPQITSWNRLLFAAGGPLVELTALTTLAGYLVWAGLVAGRVALAGRPPSASWALAAAAAGAVVCCQVLGYELLALTLLVPWIRDLFAAGRRLTAWAAVALLLSQQIPFEVLSQVGIGSHRPLGALGVALLVLFGPLAPARPGGR